MNNHYEGRAPLTIGLFLDVLAGKKIDEPLGDDMVSARLSKASREETVAHLEMVGSLLQFFRQMDAAMKSEAAVAWIKDAFLRGDYDLSGNSGQETGRQEEKKP